MLPKATALIANDPNYEFNLNYSIPRIAAGMKAFTDKRFN